MWALTKFSLILVTGMLGTTVAQESHEVEREVSDGIRHLQTTFDRSFDTYFMEIYISNLTNFTISKCEKNGATDATNAIVESFEINFNAAIAQMNETLKQLEIAVHNQHNGLNAAIAVACNFMTTMDDINKNVSYTFNPCLNSAERASIDLMNNVSSAVVQYVCENNGQRLLALLTDEGIECLDSSGPSLHNCTLTSFSSNTTIFEKTESLDSVANFPIISLNTQACREFQDLQQCADGVLRECRNTIPLSQMNALFNIVKTISGCDDFLNI